METKRLCVSISDEQKTFLELYNLSPSELLHTKIAELKANFDEFAAKELRRINEKLQAAILREQKMREFIETKGFINEFLGI